MRRIVLLAGCLAALSSPAGSLYRWVDAQGKVHYGDAPPADAQQSERKQLPTSDDADAGLTYEMRRAKANFPVVLYVADNCAEGCSRARELLSRRGIPYAEKRLTTAEEVAAFKAASGSDNVPALAVGKSWVIGFHAEKWGQELDIAGYPKVAAWRPRQAAASSAVAPTAPVSP